MREMEQKIDCLEIREEGTRLEYQYVNELKDKKIQYLTEKLNQEREENKKKKEKLLQLEEQLHIKSKKIESIEKSRW